MYDYYLSNLVIKTILIKNGFRLQEIDNMTEREIYEYLSIVSSINEVQQDSLKQ